MWDLQHTPSRRDCQLVRGTIYYGWSDSGPIAGGLISPTNTRYDRFEMALIPYYEVDFKPNQPHKTGKLNFNSNSTLQIWLIKCCLPTYII